MKSPEQKANLDHKGVGAVRIICVETKEHFQVAKELFREYTNPTMQTAIKPINSWDLSRFHYIGTFPSRVIISDLA